MKNNLKSFNELKKSNNAAVPMCKCHMDLPNGKQRDRQKRQIDLTFCERNLHVKRSEAIEVMKFWESQGKGVYYQKGVQRGEGKFVWNKEVNSMDYCINLLIS